MYKIKPCNECIMPQVSDPISVLVLNCSLKHKGTLSNTGELAELVLKYMKQYGIKSELIRVSDLFIPPGVRFREAKTDAWPKIAKKIRDCDILILATPIWWGGRSSIAQRIIERFDAFDEEYHKVGRSSLYNKVAGIVITGSEDGAQSTLGAILSMLTFMCFTLPPECCTYWVGEVGMPLDKDREKRLRNKAADKMAKNMARNLMYYAKLLKNHPMTITN